jgi:hypothetical protein
VAKEPEKNIVTIKRFFGIDISVDATLDPLRRRLTIAARNLDEFDVEGYQAALFNSVNGGDIIFLSNDNGEFTATQSYGIFFGALNEDDGSGWYSLCIDTKFRKIS